MVIIYIMETNINEIIEMSDGAVLLEGLDSAIVGVVETFGNGPCILYSKNKIIDILVTRDSMTYEEAEEYYEYNILNLWVSNQNPVFLLT
jgi:hypothetical protein